MFRALKDILQDKPHEGTTSSVGTSATTTRGGQFYGEGYTSEGLGRGGVPIVEVKRREVGPVVRETIYPTERIEIQPILRREREQIEVRELTQPILEKGSVPVRIHDQVLPEERKEMPPIPQSAIEDQLRRAKEGLSPSKNRETPVRTVEEKPIIVEEQVRKKIYEEIVPVVERHINEPHVIREKKPIYEKIYEGPTFLAKELPRIEREVPVQYSQQQPQTSGFTPGGGFTSQYGFGRYGEGFGYGREGGGYTGGGYGFGEGGGYGQGGGGYGQGEGYGQGVQGGGGYGQGGQYSSQPGGGTSSFVDVPVKTGYIPHTELQRGQVHYA